MKHSRYNPCPDCNQKEVEAHSRWEYSEGKTKLIYSWLECGLCKSISNNTTATYKWKDVLKGWDKQRKENQS